MTSQSNGSLEEGGSKIIQGTYIVKEFKFRSSWCHLARKCCFEKADFEEWLKCGGNAKRENVCI